MGSRLLQSDCDLGCIDETEVNSNGCKDLSKWADSDPFSDNTMSMKVKHRTELENGKCVAVGGNATGFGAGHQRHDLVLLVALSAAPTMAGNQPSAVS